MMSVTLNLGLQLLLHHNLSLVYLHSEENEYLITMCMLYPIPLHDILFVHPCGYVWPILHASFVLCPLWQTLCPL